MKRSNKFLLIVLLLSIYVLLLCFIIDATRTKAWLAEVEARQTAQLQKIEILTGETINMQTALMEASQPATMALFLWPMHPEDYQRKTSPFGMRVSPIYGGQYRYHRGLDLKGVWKARIRAIAGGVVSDVYPAPDGVYWRGHDTKGGYIELTHGNGWKSRYSHMSETYYNVIGEWVDAGWTIGRQGNTGLSVDPHLHFELLKDGVHVNPLIYCME